MKIFSKKISVGTGLAILFLVSSIIYSLGYNLAVEKFNRVVSSTQEKQKMYGSLSEIDYNIRNEYIGSVDEDKILNGIYKGYVSGLEDESCRILSRSEYTSYIQSKKIQSAEVSWDELEDSIGYLRIGILGKGSSEMLIERLEYFKSQEIKSVILDFRTSIDGDMEEGFKILKRILPAGDLIERVNKKGNREVVCKSEDSGMDFKIVIITGRKTSGVAEVVISVIKDFLKSKVVGEKTAGNNVREQTVDISENLVMIFPDSRYITFGGIDIYKQGLTPDKFVEVGEDDEKLIFDNNLSYQQDIQLQSAIGILKGQVM